MLYIVLVFFALATGALTVLAFENIATLMIEVHLTLFGWRAPVLPLGVLLLLSCLLGALLLYIVTVLSALRDRRTLAKLRRRIAELERLQGSSPLQQHSLPMIVPMPGIHANQPPNPPYAAR